MFKTRLYLTITMTFCLFFIVNAQNEKMLTIGQQPVYKVFKTSETITVDGKMDESSWKNAEIQPFNYFYRRDRIADIQYSKFRMLWDDKNLYLFFQCEDTALCSREKQFDAQPYLDDCAEFYCIPFPDSLYMHFAWEINIEEVPYDFIQFWSFYNGRNAVIKSYNPDYEIKVYYEGTVNDNTDKDIGWQMELAIPFDAFTSINNFFPAKAGTRWAFQAVRQDRNIIDERGRSTSTLFPIYDIFKDVHQPSRFGLMEFVE
jgi:hypothetical protein